MKKKQKYDGFLNDYEEIGKRQSELEERITMLSIENKGRQEDVEAIVFLLPHIYNIIRGKGGSIKKEMQNFGTQAYQVKVHTLLTKFMKVN